MEVEASEEAPENDWDKLARLTKEADEALDADDWDTYKELSAAEDEVRERLDKATKKAFTNKVETPETPALADRLEAVKSELTEAEKVLAERPQTPPSSPFNPIPVGSTGEESDAGLQGNYTAFAEVERLRNEVAELERRLPYAGISDEDLAIQVEDAAIAHEDAKVATKALENAGRPAAEAKAARLELESMRTWLALADEHQARLGTFGGMNERERWAPDVAHVESCTAPRQCRGGCRPIPDRVDMLEASFRLQASSFLVPGEQVA